MDLKSLKSFDWRSLKKYADPKAAEDLNSFLEKMPQNAGQTMLAIAGVVWAAAGAGGLYATVQLQKLTEMRATFHEAQALKPEVPVIRDVPVDAGAVKTFADRINTGYSGLEITASGPAINISGSTTAAFGQFREAIGHIQNGGSGWRVSIDNLCVGRECSRVPLSAVLKINKVSVDKAS